MSTIEAEVTAPGASLPVIGPCGRPQVMGRARKTATPDVSEKGASLLVSVGECPGAAAATTLGVVEYINGC